MAIEKQTHYIEWTGSDNVDYKTLSRWANNRGVPREKAEAARAKLAELNEQGRTD